MMKAEKGSEIITTICEYENSVAMPDNERLTSSSIVVLRFFAMLDRVSPRLTL